MRREKEQYSRATRRQMEKAEKMKARDEQRVVVKKRGIIRSIIDYVFTLVFLFVVMMVVVTMFFSDGNTDAPQMETEVVEETQTQLEQLLSPYKLVPAKFEDDTTGHWKSACLCYPDTSLDYRRAVIETYIDERFSEDDMVHGVFDPVHEITCRITKITGNTYEYQFYDYTEFEEYSSHKCFCNLTDGVLYYYNAKNGYTATSKDGYENIDAVKLYQ